MLVVKKLGDIDRYRVSVDNLYDNRPPKSVTMDPHKIDEEYYYGCQNMMHQNKPHHHHPHNHRCDCHKQEPIPHYPPRPNHLDHYIESQHHAKGEHKPPCKPHKKPEVCKPSCDYYREHPKRVIRPLEPFDCPFPKQEVMLLDIEANIKRSIVIDFKYNTCIVTKEIAEGDIIHAYYIDKGNLENQLTEITGMITYIDFNNMKIYVDYSSQYQGCKIDIYINTLRFISTDLYEVAPFFEEEETFDEPIIEEPIEILPPVKPEELDPEYDIDSNLDYTVDSSLFNKPDDEEKEPEEDLPTEEVIPGNKDKDDSEETPVEEPEDKDDNKEETPVEEPEPEEKEENKGEEIKDDREESRIES